MVENNDKIYIEMKEKVREITKHKRKGNVCT